MHLSYSPALPAKLIAACTAAIAITAVPAAAQAPRPVPPPAVPQHLHPPSVEELLGRRDRAMLRQQGVDGRVAGLLGHVRTPSFVADLRSRRW